MIGTLTYKMTLRPYMKPILILSALLHWDWLTNKCFKIETVTSDTVQL
ncbi:hypothetical protein JJL14_12210 [Enterobacter hormaechei]|nr:hypothetical protein [Enterobacter hormaechei]QQW41015.1 hypothetical protein JJL14_12210 [Enterobacter hormaechei]